MSEIITLEEKIAQLPPGGHVVLGQSNGCRVVVERSGDGKTLRFVRETATGFTVFKRTPHRAPTPQR